MYVYNNKSNSLFIQLGHFISALKGRSIVRGNCTHSWCYNNEWYIGVYYYRAVYHYGVQNGEVWSWEILQLVLTVGYIIIYHPLTIYKNKICHIIKGDDKNIFYWAHLINVIRFLHLDYAFFRGTYKHRKIDIKRHIV